MDEHLKAMMGEGKNEQGNLSASLAEVEKKLADLTAERKVIEKEYGTIKQKISETDHEGLELGSKITRLLEREKLLKEEKKHLKKRLQDLSKEVQKFADAEKKMKGA